MRRHCTSLLTNGATSQPIQFAALRQEDHTLEASRLRSCLIADISRDVLLMMPLSQPGFAHPNSCVLPHRVRVIANWGFVALSIPLIGPVQIMVFPTVLSNCISIQARKLLQCPVHSGRAPRDITLQERLSVRNIFSSIHALFSRINRAHHSHTRGRRTYSSY